MKSLSLSEDNALYDRWFRLGAAITIGMLCVGMLIGSHQMVPGPAFIPEASPETADPSVGIYNLYASFHNYFKCLDLSTSCLLLGSGIFSALTNRVFSRDSLYSKWARIGYLTWIAVSMTGLLYLAYIW